MLKYLGLLGLVTACGLTGILKSEELKSRIRLLEEIQNLILSLKSQMAYLKEPLFLLFEKFQRMEKRPKALAFLLPERCLAGLSERGSTIEEVWSQQAEQLYEKSALTHEDLEILCHVGTYLGQTDFQTQQMEFASTEERLQIQLKEAREVYQQKGSMYRKLGFFAGGLAALVLL